MRKVSKRSTETGYDGFFLGETLRAIGLSVSVLSRVALIELLTFERHVCSKVKFIITNQIHTKRLMEVIVFCVLKDRGVPSLNSTTTLVVKVEDQSDQPPEFEKSSYRADINENTPVVGTS